MSSGRPELVGLAIGDPAERWSALGFTVDKAGRLDLGGVSIELGGPGSGITGWRVSGLEGPVEGTQLDFGLLSNQIPMRVGENPHPNGAIAVDHVVIASPDFDRTAAALAEAGMELRRVRQAGERRQGFRRLGPAIMELVEAPEASAVTFWGLTIIVSDLELAARHMGAHLSPARPAVQPGRQIAIVSREAGLSTRLAVMDPE